MFTNAKKINTWTEFGALHIMTDGAQVSIRDCNNFELSYVSMVAGYLIAPADARRLQQAQET